MKGKTTRYWIVFKYDTGTRLFGSFSTRSAAERHAKEEVRQTFRRQTQYKIVSFLVDERSY